MEDNRISNDIGCGLKVSVDEYDKKEIEKEYILKIIKELFEDDRIDIEVDTHDEWETKYADLTVTIDGEKVYVSKTSIGSSGWSDY